MPPGPPPRAAGLVGRGRPCVGVLPDRARLGRREAGGRHHRLVVAFQMQQLRRVVRHLDRQRLGTQFVTCFEVAMAEQVLAGLVGQDAEVEPFADGLPGHRGALAGPLEPAQAADRQPDVALHQELTRGESAVLELGTERAALQFAVRPAGVAQGVVPERAVRCEAPGPDLPAGHQMGIGIVRDAVVRGGMVEPEEAFIGSHREV